MNHFYKQHNQALFESLHTSAEGLTSQEASVRIKQTGPNVLPHGKKVTFLMVVLHQFASPLIYVLIAAGIVSLFIKEYEDAIFIFLIIFINAILGTYQEWRAEASAAALQQLVKTNAKVLRDGEPVMLDAELLVPGDVVMVESGMKVPADIRLFAATNLHTEEAILTGESMPIEKKTETLPEKELPLGDQVNMLFAGTTIMSGRGQGLVVATALKTEIGKIAKSVAETKQEKTPLVQRMERFAMWVSVVVLIACSIIFIIGFFQGIPVIDIFFVAVAVAVSAIPEGLPIAMTVALSIGTSRMAKRNVIIRKLSAVEGLGSCNYIGTDKTGTLTVDQQTVKKIVLVNAAVYEVTGAGYNGEGEVTDLEGKAVNADAALDNFVEAVTICNEAQLLNKNDTWKMQGDAIDVAFLALAYKYGKHPLEERKAVTIRKEIPFESERKYAAVFYEDKNGRNRVAAKGALESILDVCVDIDPERITNEAFNLASQGYRVLAVAAGEANTALELKGLTFLGLAALIDPVKPEAKDAVTFCHDGDIQVAMITGDHPATALSIARELGLADSEDQVITGNALGLREGAEDEAYDKRIENKTVFARVSPLQKQQIVAAVKARGNFVAVTGDGVNDAPALKSADIGVAMGYGSDVAKEASSIIITDNNFASLAAGIEEGRYTYGNLRKIIYLLISTGAAEIMMVFLALVLGMPLPFLPVQLLWLNLVTNGLQDVALAFEKGEKYLLQEPPRDHKHGIFDRQMIIQTLVSGSLMMLITFGLWYHLLNSLAYEEAVARNIILLLMVLLQNFHVLNCRSERASLFHVPAGGNIFLWVAILMAQGIHILSMQVPFMQSLLRIEPVSLPDWTKLLATASIILVVMELYKLFFVRRAKPKPHRFFKASPAQP
jgi:magnesium-transporting ATPase (P-type)